MPVRKNFRHTVYACYIGYIVQAIVNNFAPLLFITFQKSYGIPLEKIAALISVNFIVQLLTDFLSAKFADKIGYRACMIGAHILSAAGLAGMAVLPPLFADPFYGLIASVVLYAIGGGLLEVLVSPIVEACPTDRKEAAMSLLHSFYCWGHVFVVLASTAFFAAFGIANWRALALVWAAVPVLNAVYFSLVPINTLTGKNEGMSIKQLFKSKAFWVLLILMICAGASEQSVSQWASAFAESGLKVSKTVGDLAGPCAFAALMGLSRAMFSKIERKIPLFRFMLLSGVLCILSYALAAAFSSPLIGLIGCALTGFSVGIFWPGTFSTASKALKTGGTAMFALLALGGDLGCASGPALVGLISGAFGDDLKKGILFAIVFPALMIVFLLINKRMTEKKERGGEKNGRV